MDRVEEPWKNVSYARKASPKKTGVPQNNKQKSTLLERPGVGKQKPNKRMVKI